MNRDKKNRLTKLYLVISILALLATLFFVGYLYFYSNNQNYEKKCVKVSTTCCPCNNGGGEKCVLESEREKYEKKLEACQENLICLTVFNCKIETCEFDKERQECVAVESEQ